MNQNQNENVKKRFNVDSPSFTPLQPNTNGTVTPSARGAAISPKAANAAIFTPKSQRSSESAYQSMTAGSNELNPAATSTPGAHGKEATLDWHSQDFQEFVPQNFEGQLVRLIFSFLSYRQQQPLWRFGTLSLPVLTPTTMVRLAHCSIGRLYHNFHIWAYLRSFQCLDYCRYPPDVNHQSLCSRPNWVVRGIILSECECLSDFALVPSLLAGGPTTHEPVGLPADRT